MTLVAICVAIPQRMHVYLAPLWRYGASFDLTIRLAMVDFLSVVHSDHASICYSYGDMAV